MPNYSITDVDFLYRRFSILDEPNYAVFWKLDNGRKIPSSAAFKTKSNEDGLSVNIAALTTPKATVGNAEEFGVAEISASTPIGLGYECEYNPQPDNNAHALIVGDTKPIAKKLAKAVTQVFNF
ncbi:MAG: hypothetical protein KA278_05430 [Flavobacterium sp.]|jgi:hypothetical protein|nr:hypothetical protein [Bacteroidota bacterium]MBL0078637.1 hypothetical protein [Bacteroidota bacterium]MBP6425143.1 hypothetical protein [Flavobacterium sp.]